MKPATDLERYLAGEFAEEDECLFLLLLKRLLAPFTKKGS